MNTLNLNAETDADAQTRNRIDPDELPELECAASRPRFGKIASLPKNIREELNYRLAEGEPGNSLLQWLNEQPETQRLMEEEFDGKPISKQNLSDWRKGGYAEWRLHCDLVHQVGDFRQAAYELHQMEDSLPLANDLVTIFTARYAALLHRWDGELTVAFMDKVRVYSRISRDLLKMQESARAGQLAEREDNEREKQERLQAKIAVWNETLAALRGNDAGEAGTHDEEMEGEPISDDKKATQPIPSQPIPKAQRATIHPQRPLASQGAGQGKVGSGQGTGKLAQPFQYYAPTPNLVPMQSSPVKPLCETVVKAVAEAFRGFEDGRNEHKAPTSKFQAPENIQK